MEDLSKHILIDLWVMLKPFIISACVVMGAVSFLVLWSAREWIKRKLFNGKVPHKEEPPHRRRDDEMNKHYLDLMREQTQALQELRDTVRANVEELKTQNRYLERIADRQIDDSLRLVRMEGKIERLGAA